MKLKLTVLALLFASIAGFSQYNDEIDSQRLDDGISVYVERPNFSYDTLGIFKIRATVTGSFTEVKNIAKRRAIKRYKNFDGIIINSKLLASHVVCVIKRKS